MGPACPAGAADVSFEENLAMIADTVAFLKKHAGEVMYDAEHFFDGYKANPGYAMKTLRARADKRRRYAGPLRHERRHAARRVLRRYGVRCAAASTRTRHPFAQRFRLRRREFLPRASSRAPCRCREPSTGMGERCGNANLCTIIPNLQLEAGVPALSLREQLRMLTSASLFVAEIANTAADCRPALCGRGGVFAQGGRACRRRCAKCGNRSSM